jgi:hypothetical protein
LPDRLLLSPFPLLCLLPEERITLLPFPLQSSSLSAQN